MRRKCFFSRDILNLRTQSFLNKILGETRIPWGPLFHKLLANGRDINVFLGISLFLPGRQFPRIDRVGTEELLGPSGDCKVEACRVSYM